MFDFSGLLSDFGIGEQQYTGEGADVEKILATIRQRESGGRYEKMTDIKGSTASGAYQFTQETWQSEAKKVPGASQYKLAKDAPKEVQDAVARQYVQSILKESGGDVSKVPLKWYTGNIQGKMSKEAMAKNRGLTPEAYQSKWMADYAKQGGSTTIPSSGPSPTQQASFQPTPMQQSVDTGDLKFATGVNPSIQPTS